LQVGIRFQLRDADRAKRGAGIVRFPDEAKLRGSGMSGLPGQLFRLPGVAVLRGERRNSPQSSGEEQRCSEEQDGAGA